MLPVAQHRLPEDMALRRLARTGEARQNTLTLKVYVPRPAAHGSAVEIGSARIAEEDSGLPLVARARLVSPSHATRILSFAQAGGTGGTSKRGQVQVRRWCIA